MNSPPPLPSPDALAAAGGTIRRLALPAILLAGIALAYAFGLQNYFTFEQLAAHRQALKAFVASEPLLAYAGFICIYICTTVLSLPAAALLTVTSGFLFGWLPGAAAAMTGASIGATILFLIARSAFGRHLRRRIRGRAAEFAQGFERNAFSFLLALRLAPVLPFFLMNILPAAFNVPLRIYVGATVLGIIPGALAYSWLGIGLDSVILAAARSGRGITLRDIITPEILMAFGALAIVAVLPAVVRSLMGRRHRQNQNH